ncbi:hypothetical protein H4219_002228 [Mycoemilia scoparia]|uniref:Solute carrier family 39 member 9 n=1 Tax=Mycoemilia scoparia TaxID=417184 RepID=A0A9W7ZY10_9FUNG|nr:hypothetical protein H4219_002228 [Mycoemilia scoparia]
MSPILVLILLSLAMLLGSLAAGSIPLFFKFSPRGFNYISLFGAGLLVGAVLSVILPEGIESIFHAAEIAATKGSDKEDASKVNTHLEVGLMLMLGFVIMLAIDRCIGGHSHHSHSHSPPADIESASARTRPSVSAQTPSSSSYSQVEFQDTIEMTVQKSRHKNSNDIDEATRDCCADDDPPTAVSSSRLGSCSMNRSRRASAVGNAAGQPSSNEIWPLGIPSTLIGVMVHAAADGVAMGATALGSEPAVEIIIFIALTLHKAPEAFGLVTSLLQGGFPQHRMKHWLLIFALITPLSSIVSYLLLSLVLPDPQTSVFKVTLWAGRILLFSASTFLYVALCHTLPEAMDAMGPGRLSPLHALLLVVGMLLPFVLAISFGH